MDSAIRSASISRASPGWLNFSFLRMTESFADEWQSLQPQSPSPVHFRCTLAPMLTLERDHERPACDLLRASEPFMGSGTREALGKVLPRGIRLGDPSRGWFPSKHRMRHGFEPFPKSTRRASSISMFGLSSVEVSWLYWRPMMLWTADLSGSIVPMPPLTRRGEIGGADGFDPDIIILVSTLPPLTPFGLRL